MNKKLILASLLCLGALVGCGGGDKPANSETDTTPTPGTSEVAPTPGTSETTPAVNYGTLEAPLTIAEARAIIATIPETEAGKGKPKFVTEGTIYTKGVVSSIKEDKFGYSATIKDGENELYVYNGKTKEGVNTPVVGDEVICSGLGQNFAGKYELVAAKQGENYVGPTYEAITAKGDVTPDTPTPDTPTGTVAEMKYSGVTTRFTGEGNEAATVNLDANLFTVTARAGTKMDTYVEPNVPMFPGLNKAGEIRIYGEGGDHGVEVKIAEGYEITTIKITSSGGALVVKAGTTEVTGTEGAYTINASSFDLTNTAAGQVKIKSITINYAAK